VNTQTQPEVFMSYAWGGESEAVADRLYTYLKNEGFNVIRDKVNLKYKGNIKDFMQRIGRGMYVVVIVSDKYLRSPNCMYEIEQIQANEDAYSRVFPVILEDANILNPIGQLAYIKHWEGELSNLNGQLKTIGNLNLVYDITVELGEYGRILDAIGSTMAMLRKMCTFPLVGDDNADFRCIANAISEKMEQDGGVKESTSVNDYAFSKLSEIEKQQTDELIAKIDKLVEVRMAMINQKAVCDDYLEKENLQRKIENVSDTIKELETMIKKQK